MLWDRAHRRADLQRHRLAGPAHRGTLPRSLGGSTNAEAEFTHKTGLVLDPYFSYFLEVFNPNVDPGIPTWRFPAF